jgi:hypothetical protein
MKGGQRGRGRMVFCKESLFLFTFFRNGLSSVRAAWLSLLGLFFCYWWGIVTCCGFFGRRGFELRALHLLGKQSTT